MRTLKFGGKLYLFRRERGATIAEASAKCGVPARTWERIEAGENAPSAAHLLRIMKKWKIALDAVEPEDLEEDGIA
jgi:transcriptional regulator with XRE-family HTH domain